MKKMLITFVFLFIFQNYYSQEKLGEPFFTSSLNVTLGRNEYDNGFGDGEPFFSPAALFLRAGFGYEIKKRVALSLNAGFDYHWDYATSAFPTYAALKYNITENDGNTFFVEMSYGKMWRPSPKYSDGNYYGFGLGIQIADSKRWSPIVRLDFHRKGLVGFKNNRLDSVSFGVGFSFF
jgi:hypothetical protein